MPSRDPGHNVNDLPYGSVGLATWRRRTDTFLTALALGSLPILLLEFVSDRLNNSDRVVITSVNILVFVAFLVDYIVELSVARDRKSYIRHEWTSPLIVVSQGLALLPALGALGVLRVVRGLKPLIFFVRIASIGSAEAHELRRTLKTRAMSTALSVAGLVWITSAVAFTLVEDVGAGRRVNSFGDALWWSASTISTVGYGDVYPITLGGRIIAVFTMVVGVSTFGVITASIAKRLIRED
jgi:voltage-gated potassium channel